MAKRRSRGDGGLHWDERRQRWIATVTVGYKPNGKRIVKSASDKTKTGAQAKLKEMRRDLDDGFAIAPHHYSVAEAARDWLAFGLSGRSANTVDNYRCMTDRHIVADLGARKLRELTADDVDRWLHRKSTTVSTRSLRLLHALLVRVLTHAQKRDKVKRNVAALCDVPTGQQGRPSKSLTLPEAEAVLGCSEGSPLHAYVVLSLLIGARTEELRALTWAEVDLIGKPDAVPPVLPSVSVWRSVREGGDTKTRRSRRTLAMPARCVAALTAHRARQDDARDAAGERWQEHGLVFASAVGTPLDAHNVRRAFRRVVQTAGLDAAAWTPRELRHSFVSLLSDAGVAIEDIARLVGHSGTAVTEAVYRHQLRPVMQEGATTMDELFPHRQEP